MKIDARQVAVALAPGALLALLGLGLGALFAATLTPDERAVLGEMIAPRAPLLVLGWAVLAIALGALARRVHAIWVTEPARLAEAAQATAAGGLPHRSAPRAQAACGAGARALAGVVDELVRQRDGLRANIDARVQEAARGIEQERSRLAALMSELTQSVVVCNLDGRILLYNNRARLQFRALSSVPTPAGGAELIGLDRSIYALFDRELIAHALGNIQQRLLRGAPQPSAQFVTSSHAGQLLRVQLAPVRDPSAAPGDDAQLSGFVLMLQNITREFEEDVEQDRLLHGLTEGSRSSLGSLQAAVDMLELPDLDAPTRERFLRVVHDEVRTMTARLQSLAASASQGLKTRWPLEDMLGADLVQAALRLIEARSGARASAPDVDPHLWLRVDSYALLQALASLATRLVDEFAVERVQLRLRRAGERAHLDLVWTGTAISTETVTSWESSPMTVGDQGSPLSVRDVVERHGGEFWFQRERALQESFFCFLLPLAPPQEQLEAAAVLRSESRPEYYDFDLFQPGIQSRELNERRLVDLAYTVFDTETTGLDPSQGDEIIQIGAVRIVNGKLLRQESFEQLIDPGRSIPAAGVPLHGITPAMVADKPGIAKILPIFHAFASDTVLVAHNAAFDMRFLQLKEASTGVRFDQPVLDTLLLSAVASPHQASHELEAIAERFGIAVLGRHTALGDAILTAEVFLRLIPLLAGKGIHTLGQARDAAQRTWYARLKY
jgi:DNA polymerase-3 subunit epsilon